MKYQIKCINSECSKLLRYEDYCEDVRRTPFTGVFCPYCGVEQEVNFIRTVGTGKKLRVTYEDGRKNRNNKTEEYRSCSACYTYWRDSGKNECPICRSCYVSEEIESTLIPKNDKPNSYLNLLLSIEDKKLQLSKNQEGESLIHEKIVGRTLSHVGGGQVAFDIRKLHEAFSKADRVASYLRGQIKFIAHEISTLEKFVKL